MLILENARLCVCVHAQGAQGATGMVGAQGVNGSDVSKLHFVATFASILFIFCIYLPPENNNCLFKLMDQQE